MGTLIFPMKNLLCIKLSLSICKLTHHSKSGYLKSYLVSVIGCALLKKLYPLSYGVLFLGEFFHSIDISFVHLSGFSQCNVNGCDMWLPSKNLKWLHLSSFLSFKACTVLNRGGSLRARSENVNNMEQSHNQLVIDK